MASRLRALRVVHPFPSFLNAALVLAIALVAGGAPSAAVLLALGMLGLQFCIGITNDLVDARLDALTKPWKPIAAGTLSASAGRALAVGSGGIGLAAAATQGLPAALMALLMLACGLVYDFWLKPTRRAWACFSVAFAILPVYAWYGAVAQLPPLPQLLIPLAAVAGPALQLSNGLVDLEGDWAGGVPTLATRLGRRGTLLAIASLLIVIHGLAWVTLTISVSHINLAVAGASVLAVAGFVFQTRASTRSREVGWSMQAAGIALLGLGWLSAVA